MVNDANTTVRVSDTTVATVVTLCMYTCATQILVILGPCTPVVTGDILVRLFVVLLLSVLLWDGQEDQPCRGAY